MNKKIFFVAIGILTILAMMTQMSISASAQVSQLNKTNSTMINQTALAESLSLESILIDRCGSYMVEDGVYYCGEEAYIKSLQNEDDESSDNSNDDDNNNRNDELPPCSPDTIYEPCADTDDDSKDEKSCQPEDDYCDRDENCQSASVDCIDDVNKGDDGEDSDPDDEDNLYG